MTVVPVGAGGVTAAGVAAGVMGAAGAVGATDAGGAMAPGPSLQFHHVKFNKNIINLSGICIILVIYSFGSGIFILDRFGYILQDSLSDVIIVCWTCSAPVLFPTIYFMRNPKHLISVLQDQNLI